MKQNIKVFVCLLTFFTLWYGCTKTEDGEYTPPITNYEKVPGTWQLLSVKLIDETAKAAGIKPDEMTLTNQLNFQGFSLTLEVDANNKPVTYYVTGDAPELLTPQGYWDLDADFPQTNGTPVKINLYTDAAKTQKVHQLSITAMPGANAEMEIKLTHTSNQVAYVSYVYRLFLAEQQ